MDDRGSARFAPLLLALALQIVAAQPLIELGYRGLAWALLVPAVLAGALLAVAPAGRTGRIAAALFLAAMLLELWAHAHSARWLVVASNGLDALFVSWIATLLLRQVIAAERVDLNTILGGICGYLLLGNIFLSLYAMVEVTAPGSFLDRGQALKPIDDYWLGSRHELLYFSFVTLSTLGYGDITAVSSLARSLAVVEAILGQLYVAIMIASLVGLRLAQRREGR